MNRDAVHCVVIGAGIVGASCAWHLRSKGYQVTIIDPVAPGEATSFGNAGCISPSGIIPFSYPGVIRQVPGWLLDPLGPLRIRWGHLPSLVPWLWRFWRAGAERTMQAVTASQVKLMATVTEDYDHILEATGAEHLRQSKGIIVLYDSEREFQQDWWQYELKTRHGIDWRRLDDCELGELEPAIRLPSGVATTLPDWQHLLDPGKVTRTIADDCLSHGGQWIQDKVQAVAQTADGKVSLTTVSGQQVTADQLVVASGVWSNQIAEQLDHKVPLMPKRGYHNMLAQPSVELNHPIQSASRLFVMTPMAEGMRIAGTAEFAKVDAEPDYRRAEVLVKHARHYLPDLTGEACSQWMGQRPMMPDSLPVISRSPAHKNVFYAFGHGHYGLTQGPTSGRIITSLISGEDPGLDLTPYRFDRF